MTLPEPLGAAWLATGCALADSVVSSFSSTAGAFAAPLAPVSKTTSGAPTATTSPGSPAREITLPVTGEDSSTAALSVIIVPTTSSSDT